MNYLYEKLLQYFVNRGKGIGWNVELYNQVSCVVCLQGRGVQELMSRAQTISRRAQHLQCDKWFINLSLVGTVMLALYQ